MKKLLLVSSFLCVGLFIGLSQSDFVKINAEEDIPLTNENEENPVNSNEENNQEDINIIRPEVSYTSLDSEKLEFVNEDCYLLGDVISFNKGTCYLNDTLIDGNEFIISQYGENNFKLVDEDNNEFNYTFYCLNIEGIEKGKSYEYNQVPTITSNINDIKNVTVKLNGEDYAFEPLTYFGNYKLEIFSLNDKLVDTYTFSIDPRVYISNYELVIKDSEVSEILLNSKAITGTSFSVSTSSNISWTNTALESYLSNKNIYTPYTSYNPGNNYLRLVGVGGYEINFTYKVNLNSNLVDSKTYTGSVLPVLSGGHFKLNNLDYFLGTEITEAGDYKFDVYNDSDELVKSTLFKVVPYEINVHSTDSSNYEVINHDVIPFVGGNKVTVLYNDEEETIYTSNKPLTKVGKYILKVDYKDYSSENNSNIVSYYFEIKKGVNIINNKEYFNNVTILYSGYKDVSLYYENGPKSVIYLSVKSGLKLDVIGDYVLELDGEKIKFRISLSLLVENARTYGDGTYIFRSINFKTTDLKMSLTCENGTKDESKLTIIDDIESINNKYFSKGSYSLKITGRGNYEKIINFIVIDYSLRRGNMYDNGKSFNFNMYGVSLILNYPLNTLDRERKITPYSEGTEIGTVGKHYFIFKFNLNNVEVETDAAMYFYIKPIVTFNDEVTTSTSLRSDEKGTLSFKDSEGNDYLHFNMDNNSLPLVLDSEYTQIGNHAITVILDDASYKINLTLDTKFVLDDVTINDETTKNKYDLKVKVSTITKTNLVLDEGTNDISNEVIDTIGNHTLIIKGTNNYLKKYNFEINEIVKFNQDVVYSELDYKSLNGEALTKTTYSTINKSFNVEVNGNAVIYVNEEKTNFDESIIYSEIGYYLIKVVGSNKYEKIYRFAILDDLKINGETPLKSYSRSVIATLDNIKEIKLSTPTKVSNELESLEEESKVYNFESLNIVGQYYLICYGVGNYISIYDFKIINSLNIESNDVISPIKDVTLDHPFKLSKENETLYKDIKLNGESITSFNMNSYIGNYVYEITDINNHKLTYKVVLKPVLLYNDSLVKEDSFLTSVKITLANNLTMDEEEIITNSVGNNVVSLKGLNGYKSEVNILIKETNILTYLFDNKDDAKNNKTSSSNVDITFGDLLTYDILIDGVSKENANLDIFGLHEIKVKGVNKYFSKPYYVYIDFDSKIIDGTSYRGSINIINNAKEVYINETKLNSLFFNKVGNLVIKYIGNSNEEVYQNIVLKEEFKLDESKENLKLNKEDAKLNPLSNYIIETQDTYDLLLDNVSYDGKSFNEFGLHEITVVGLNNYLSKYYVFIKLDTTLVDGNTYYYDDTFISNSYKFYCNDIELDSSSIPYIGNNKIKFVSSYFDEEVLDVIIKPRINLPKVNDVSVIPSISGINKGILLDNNVYEGNSIISIGNHVLTILGNNGYSEDYEFSVLGSLLINDEDLINNKVVVGKSTLTYKKDTTYKAVYLNNKLINLPISLNQVGINEIKVIDFNDNEIIYSITIKENYDEDDIKLFSSISEAKLHPFNVNDDLIFSFNDNLVYSLILDNNEYNNTSLTSYGLHEIKVIGLDYESTYYAYVSLDINVNDNDILTNLTSIRSNAKEVLINGTKSNVLDSVGNYELVIKGETNDDEVTFNVTLKETSLGSKLYLTKEDAIENKVNKLNVLFDSSINYEVKITASYKENEDITTFGLYEINLTGVNGYEVTYFAYIDLDVNLNNDEIIYLNKEISSNANKVLVNGELTNEISLLGNNVITLKGNNVEDVTINVINKEIVELNSSEHEVTPIIKGNYVSLKLDGNEYIKDTVINTVGNHVLSVYGINNYVSNYEFSLNTKVLGNDEDIIDNHIYLDKVVLSLNSGTLSYSNVTLNGTKINLPYVIDKVGNYELVVININDKDQIVHFSLVESPINDTYNLSSTIGEAKLNPYKSSDLFIPTFKDNLKYDLFVDNKNYSNEPITVFGLHEITLKGESNYETKYYVYISLDYKDNQKEVNNIGLVNINSNAYELYIDGVKDKSITSLNKIGYHEIKVLGQNNEEERFNILIKENLTMHNDDIFVGVTLPCLGITDNLVESVILDGTVINCNYVVREIGHHELIINGSNGYKSTYKFTLEPRINFKIEFDPTESKYFANISLVDVNKTLIDSSLYEELSVDGIAYSNGTSLYKIGNHTLSIKGRGGYELKKEFTIEAYTEVENTAKYTSKVIIAPKDCEVKLDGSEVTKNTTVSNGTHVLEIIGTNGYYETITFTYENPNIRYAFIYAIIITIISGGVIGGLILRNVFKKKRGI